MKKVKEKKVMKSLSLPETMVQEAERKAKKIGAVDFSTYIRMAIQKMNDGIPE